MTVYMWIASIAWTLLIMGYCVRSRRTLHVPLMLSGIIIDFALVAFLEMNRGAVETAFRFELTPLKQTHIAFSSIALCLYFPVLWFGIRLLRDSDCGQTRRVHARIGKAALFFRTLGFFFMFSMWKA